MEEWRLFFSLEVLCFKEGNFFQKNSFVINNLHSCIENDNNKTLYILEIVLMPNLKLSFYFICFKNKNKRTIHSDSKLPPLLFYLKQKDMC